MMEPKQDESLFVKYVRIVFVVALYWTVSISMVFVNKALLGGASMGKTDAPLFVTWFQCVVTAVSCLLASKATRFAPNLLSFPELGRIESGIVKKVLPLSVIFVAMISTNNFCLKYLGVAFYYVGRSLSTVFNVLFTYLILGQKTSTPALVSCGVIIGGFWLGVDQESVAGSLSLIGIVFGVLASMFVSLNAIFTKRVLPALEGSVWKLSYYNNVLASLLFMPLILVSGEGPAVYALLTASADTPSAKDPYTFWGLMVLGGIFGFGVGYVTGLQIQVTSPLTHTISGTAKACTQTVLATWWYVEHKTGLWWLSNWTVLAGSMAYTRVKQLEMKKQHSAGLKMGPVSEDDDSRANATEMSTEAARILAHPRSPVSYPITPTLRPSLRDGYTRMCRVHPASKRPRDET
ncbi:GDP-fucose transporter 1-like isoform X1 [Eriocheir sinensis]|uniref:GDP-fucose transporter 1-like isoform X1 n=1 Tax=Eriocheir sinensis TaxID=95602 RepID=UPI0021C9A551|nr:GDP-fucose transporter 1-like isoform X1 [Eriocheir sinensis]